ncbi:hypothetical protein SAMN05428978_10564 [Nitrosomonas sp. Nm34]|nr:hypothetical protein SAMN05428978_10564 [Nitrosomonas sp. Nm34]
MVLVDRIMISISTKKPYHACQESISQILANICARMHAARHNVLSVAVPGDHRE